MRKRRKSCIKNTTIFLKNQKKWFSPSETIFKQRIHCKTISPKTLRRLRQTSKCFNRNAEAFLKYATAYLKFAMAYFYFAMAYHLRKILKWFFKLEDISDTKKTRSEFRSSSPLSTINGCHPSSFPSHWYGLPLHSPRSHPTFHIHQWYPYSEHPFDSRIPYY